MSYSLKVKMSWSLSKEKNNLLEKKRKIIIIIVVQV